MHTSTYYLDSNWQHMSVTAESITLPWMSVNVMIIDFRENEIIEFSQELPAVKH